MRRLNTIVAIISLLVITLVETSDNGDMSICRYSFQDNEVTGFVIN